MKDPVICPVCKTQNTTVWSIARDYEYLSTEKYYKYYHCHECNTIFIDPLPLEELTTIYPPNYYSFTGKKNWAFSIKEWLDKKLLWKVLKKIKDEKINVLDIGGGTGWLLSLIKKIDPRINITHVVDIDINAKQEAENQGHRYFQGRIEEFYTDQKFHLILMLNLIEHISNPEAVLQKIQKYLAPGGIILIKTPNIKSLDSRLFRKSYWGGLHCPRHWIIFSEKSFRKMLQGTNLEISSLKYTQGGPFWAFSIITYLSRKKILKVSKERPVIYHSLFPITSSLFAAFDFIRRPFAKTSQMFITLKTAGDFKS
ncbi:MAG: class I SAM-dependent methyltransferase [Bacteroidota bacterium]|nr:class I SAM-dependent methyltransferase [Bacteroidota bacterium]